jgi:hypothetical protein
MDFSDQGGFDNKIKKDNTFHSKIDEEKVRVNKTANKKVGTFTLKSILSLIIIPNSYFLDSTLMVDARRKLKVLKIHLSNFKAPFICSFYRFLSVNRKINNFLECTTTTL